MLLKYFDKINNNSQKKQKTIDNNIDNEVRMHLSNIQEKVIKNGKIVWKHGPST